MNSADRARSQPESDRLLEVYRQHREEVKSDLLRRLVDSPPAFFERVVVELPVEAPVRYVQQNEFIGRVGIEGHAEGRPDLVFVSEYRDELTRHPSRQVTAGRGHPLGHVGEGLACRSTYQQRLVGPHTILSIGRDGVP